MEENKMATFTQVETDIVAYDDDQLAVLAQRAEQRVRNLNTIMTAAIKMTTAYDWTIIGGKPYLQESGADKVARLFGISWKNVKYECEIDGGYPAYTCTMTMCMGNTEIECIGGRSGKDEFFTGKGDKKKSADAIDKLDVKKSAYTNALNNGIKRILPGLRNIDISVLEQAGLNLNKSSGYSFKTGNNGGNTGTAEESGIVCSCCGKPVTSKVASFSQGKFGAILCMACQKNGGKQQISAPQDDDGYLPPEPPEDRY